MSIGLSHSCGLYAEHRLLRDDHTGENTRLGPGSTPRLWQAQPLSEPAGHACASAPHQTCLWAGPVSAQAPPLRPAGPAQPEPAPPPPGPAYTTAPAPGQPTEWPRPRSAALRRRPRLAVGSRKVSEAVPPPPGSPTRWRAASRASTIWRASPVRSEA